MTHPTDIPGLRAALFALDAGDLPTIPTSEGVSYEQAQAATDAVVTALQAAQATVSPVPQCGQIVDALKPHVEILGLDAARLLACAAHLILTNSWLGRAEEADEVRDQARARIAALGG